MIKIINAVAAILAAVAVILTKREDIKFLTAVFAAVLLIVLARQVKQKWAIKPISKIITLILLVLSWFIAIIIIEVAKSGNASYAWLCLVVLVFLYIGNDETLSSQ